MASVAALLVAGPVFGASDPGRQQPANQARGIAQAVVDDFSARPIGNSAQLEWTTRGELGVLSFEIYRQQGTGWLKVNDQEIPAQGPSRGNVYTTIDPGLHPGESAICRLVGIDQYDNRTELGCYSVRVQPGTLPWSARGQVAKFPSVAAKSISPGPSPLPLSALDGNLFVKIATTNTGIQAVPSDRLALLLGQPVAIIQSAILAGQFRLSNRGMSMPWFAGPDGSAILFYAQAYKDNYTDRNVFWLTDGTRQPAPFVDGSCPVTPAEGAFYRAELFEEHDSLAVPSLPLNPEDDFWMWSRFVAGIGGYDTLTLPLSLESLPGLSNLGAQMTLACWGGNTAAHRVEVQVNGQAITNMDWQGLAPVELTLAFPASLLAEGSNVVVLKALVIGSTSPRSQWYLNQFGISYPRRYVSHNGSLEFSAASNAVVCVQGFARSNVSVLELSAGAVVAQVTNLNIEAAADGYRASFVPRTPQARFIAFDGTAGFAADSINLARVCNFSSSTNAFDYLVIAPESLLSAATNLAAYRGQTGLRTLTATLDPIYNECAFGFTTPHAIQTLLSNAVAHWRLPPRYCALIGDGTYDYRNIQLCNDNLMPALLVSTPYGLFCSDSLYGDVNGDGSVEIAVGRLPGNTPEEVIRLTDKVKTYEAQLPPALPQDLLIADAPDAAGDFNADIQAVGDVLQGKFTNSILRRSDVANAALMTTFVTNTWKPGLDLVNYIGHGAIDRFGSAGYLSSVDVTNLSCPRLPIVISITCVAGQYSVPGSDCLGESLLARDGGGAIGVIAPTGLSWDSEASQLNLRLAGLIDPNVPRSLGDMFRQAMSEHITVDHPSMPAWIYNLLADPALRYGFARELRITSLAVTNQTSCLSWVGGRPPYQVERRTPLDPGTPWQAVGAPTYETNLLFQAPEDSAFYRVRYAP